MRRRREGGLTGRPFERTEAVWRALGAPRSLYEEEAAARAQLWCSAQPYRYAFAYADPREALREGAQPTIDAMVLPQARAWLARVWWLMGRPLFLSRVRALTAEERAKMLRRPAYYEPSDRAWNLAAVERELTPRRDSG